MDMETANNTLKHKIDSVNDLPEGYQPNLASKWELLEAGLRPVERERKPVLFYVKRISAVAAMLLMIGGSWLIMVRKPQPAKPQANIENRLTQPALTRVAKPALSATSNEHKSKHDVRIVVKNKANVVPPSKQLPTPEIGPTPENNACKPVEEETPIQVVAVKPPHFTEVDFTEPILTNTPPAESVVKAQRFRFKLGGGNESPTQAGTAIPRGIGFKTSF